MNSETRQAKLITGDSARQLSVAERLTQLRQQMSGVELANRMCSDVVSSGYAELDRLLPAGGFMRGTLVEWLAPHSGSGAATLALLTAMQACGMHHHRAGNRLDSVPASSGGGCSSAQTEPTTGTTLVLVDRFRRLYPPTVIAWGAALEHVLLVRANTAQEEIWALDQALRCRAVGAAWACCEQLDSHAFRRLQLAAEANGTLGVLVRPAKAQGLPSWADVQLLAEPVRDDHEQGWRLKITLLRVRRGAGKADAFEGASVTVAIGDDQSTFQPTNGQPHETNSFPLVSALGHSASRRRPA